MKINKTIIALLATVLIFSYGNKVYSQEIKIGNQTWSTKNLDVSTFRNGDTIPEAKIATEWEKAGDEGKPAWCYYDNDPANGKKYGKMYNWYAVSDLRGLAPSGWHVPSNEEWTTIIDFLGGEELACTKMKSASGWEDFEGKKSNGNNTSGFAGMPGGYRYLFHGTFNNLGSSGSWWSSTSGESSDAWYIGLHNDETKVMRFKYSWIYGYSVRCVKD